MNKNSLFKDGKLVIPRSDKEIIKAMLSGKILTVEELRRIPSHLLVQYEMKCGTHHSKEFREKKSLAMMGEKNPNFGKHLSGEETGDWLIENVDQLQKFIERQIDDRLRKTCSIRFEGNPRILTDVLQMHKAINREKEERLFHFGSEIEIISIAERNTHLLRTRIPDKSYLVYIVDNDVEIDSGWLGLNIENVIGFCNLGDYNDNFRYRYDSKLNDFYIQHRGLRRKFGGIDPDVFSRLQISDMTFHGRATVNLRQLLKEILKPAYELDFEGIKLQLAYNQLQAYGSRQFGEEESIDEIDHSIKTENWNGEIVSSSYTVPLLKELVELLSKCFTVGEIAFSNDGAMRISCGQILGNEDDDLFSAEMMLAYRKEDSEEED